MDQLGTIGPQANNYFYHTKQTPFIKDTKDLNKFTIPGLKAYKKNIEDKKYTNIFKQANDGWKLTHKNTWYGKTYQTTCPSTWGALYLNTHINKALIQHIHTSFQKLRNTTKQHSENKNKNKTGNQVVKQNKFKHHTLSNQTQKRKPKTPQNNKKRPNDKNSTNESYIKVYDTLHTKNHIPHMTSTNEPPPILIQAVT